MLAIEHLAKGAGDEHLVIFPEGTFYTAARAARVMERLAERDPERAARLDLRHLLPARPGGILALLRGSPEVDMLLIAHVGFEPFGSLRAILHNVPFQRPLRIHVWRVPTRDIDDNDEARLLMIDQCRQRMDDWIDGQSDPTETS